MLASERLRLEPLSVRHAAEFAAYRRRNRVYLTPWEPMGSEESFTEAYQVTAIARVADDMQQANFVLFEQDGDLLIGECNLFNIRRGIVQAAIIGYSVDEAHAGRGYASEAAGMVVKYAFETLGLHRLETSYNPKNEASGRVLIKNGFRVEGYARDYLFIDGAWRDSVMVARTNPAFRWETETRQ
jgi:ribosomal-protein-alanine N-acetyltransferase